MHFNFFSRLKESMNLSELLIIFVNKVLITQTKNVLFIYLTQIPQIHCAQQKVAKINKPGHDKTC